MSLDYLLIKLDSDMYNFEYFQQVNVCRLCWKTDPLSQLIEISTENTLKNDIVDKIIDCLEINLKPSSLPKNICSDCFDRIDKYYSFKKFCQKSDKKLREILSNHENSTIKKEDVVGDETFDCFESLKGSDSENDLKIEELRKYNKRKPKRTPSYCNICRLDFENAEKFEIHNSKCHGVENGGFKCFGCTKLFKNRKSRLGHEVNFCKSMKDGYKCVSCDRHLPRRGMYESHMRDHQRNVAIQLPDELFKCIKCDLSYKTKQLLQDHGLKVHKNDVKKYVCESCGRVFTRNDYLLKHKLTHTGEKQYECPHCSFRATQRSSLTVHIRKHTGERPYECSFCPQRCISSSNLRAHQQRHLGIKSHECKVCNKKFGYKVSLQEHMATHMPTQAHQCEQCTASYSRLRALKRHMAARHPEKNPPD
ncbi:zinc finger protein OZF [Bicyclus anynana]|uniref:Zinc finger protein OZF n=1 Tax=Bicyclus anynana TaxID=110368 RepID=A0ABM3M2G1_BICAN|nr:zinc finger protein OZF [Bicyclus anynana]XP_052745685.1 zinc finger protein OZF [Bicyclus anynana]XP_052745686.1 zinc finger protein OZF [Bicyclus anynana]